MFCGLTKGISPKSFILCVCVKINKRSFEPICVWTFENMSDVCACISFCICVLGLVLFVYLFCIYCIRIDFVEFGLRKGSCMKRILNIYAFAFDKALIQENSAP